MDQSRGGSEGPHSGRLREEEQVSLDRYDEDNSLSLCLLSGVLTCLSVFLLLFPVLTWPH